MSSKSMHLLILVVMAFTMILPSYVLAVDMGGGGGEGGGSESGGSSAAPSASSGGDDDDEGGSSAAPSASSGGDDDESSDNVPVPSTPSTPSTPGSIVEESSDTSDDDEPEISIDRCREDGKLAGSLVNMGGGVNTALLQECNAVLGSDGVGAYTGGWINGCIDLPSRSLEICSAQLANELRGVVLAKPAG